MRPTARLTTPGTPARTSCGRPRTWCLLFLETYDEVGIPASLVNPTGHRLTAGTGYGSSSSVCSASVAMVDSSQRHGIMPPVRHSSTWSV
jgi:hypothetical protein